MKTCNLLCEDDFHQGEGRQVAGQDRAQYSCENSVILVLPRILQYIKAYSIIDFIRFYGRFHFKVLFSVLNTVRILRSGYTLQSHHVALSQTPSLAEVFAQVPR